MKNYRIYFAIIATFCTGLLGPAQNASAHEHEYSAILTGPGGASGNADVLLDLDLITLDVDFTFSGLTSPTVSAFINGRTAVPLTGAAGQALPLPAFPIGLLSGSSTDFIDLAIAPSYTSAFITASGGTVSDALNATSFGLDASQMYIQINDANGPALTGFLIPVPEPSSLGLVFILLLGMQRRHKLAYARI